MKSTLIVTTLYQIPLFNAWEKYFATNLEHVCSTLRGHRKSKEEEENADPEGEGLSNRPQRFRPHVHDPGHEALHNAELTVNANGL